MVVGVGAVTFGLARRRNARSDRRLLQACASTACSRRSSTRCSRSRSSCSRSRSSRCSPRPRSTRTGNQTCAIVDPTAGRADLRARRRVDPDPRPHHACELAAVVAAGVRAGRARAGRDQPAGHDARGAPQRAARDVLDRAAGDRGRDRRRRWAVDPRCRRAPARGLVGQHDREHARRPASRCRTSCSSRSLASSSPCCRSNYLGDIVRARTDVRESAL